MSTTGSQRRANGHQQGAVLLVLMAALIVMGSVVFVSRCAPHSDAAARTAEWQALRKAKQALIEYAVHYDLLYGASGTGPGHLPCPDSDGDGVPEPNCAANALGRLPRHVAGASYVFTEMAHVGLWYAVADRFRYNPSIKVNSNTQGSLRLDSNTNVAAMLIAPGPALEGQQRPGVDPSDYLEGENANGDHIYSRDIAGNDLVLPIYAHEILLHAERRVLGAMRHWLRDYRSACGGFPWPAPAPTPYAPAIASYAGVPGSLHGLLPVDNWQDSCPSAPAIPAWFRANGWHHLAYYTIADATVPLGSTTCAPCLSVTGGAIPIHDALAVVLIAGAALPNQFRGPSSTIADYFEHANATPADGKYAFAPDANDIILVVQ